MLSRLCRIARRSSASPFEPPADRFNPLALSVRLAFAGALTTGLGTSAYAQAQIGTTQEVSKDTKELPAVTVNAESGSDFPQTYAGGQLARDGRVGLLGNKSVMDTPFSVSDYTSKRMEDQQAVTLAEVLNKDPSTRFTGQIGGVTDSFFIRGFPVNEGNLSEVAFDGVYGVSPNYHLFTEYLERVEVLKGPAALLYGMSPNSGVGGVINVVPKRPLNKDLTRVTLDYASDSQVGEAIDLSRRFGSERQFGIRFNGLHRQGSTPLDNQKSRAEVGALSLDYQGERFRASLDVIEQYQWVDAPTRPFLVASGIQVPSAPDGRRNVTQSWGWWKSNDTSTLLHAEYDVNDHVTVFADAGGTKSDVSRLSDQTPTILNSAGDTTATPQNWKFQINRSTADTGVRTQFSTGAVKHAVVLQANVYQDRIASASNSGKAILSNIYSPIASPEQNVSVPTSVPKLSASTLSGVALADTMSMLNERLQLTLGVRQQHVQSDNFSATTGARTSSYNESATTPLVGVVVKPWQNVSFYANYIEGLSKGDIAPTTASNAGQVFAPYKTKQEEVGVKLDMSGVLATLAAFRITKPSGQLYGTVYSVDSEQRNQGLELNVSGEPLKGVRLLGGVTLLDATLTKTNSAATVGNRPVGVPTWMANVGTEWDLPWVPGFTLTGGVNYTGREYVNQANTQSVPSWTTVDLGARYQTRLYGKSTTVRAGLLNAFDRKYWSGVASYGTISLGAPRTIFLSASVDF
ncbi:TonB-dependent receptor [Paraburkholderia haematera]|uniref:Ferrichrome receptor FcuA n=1 Tax=Paraburkholderia haematera TaxID=2793077 RepID=A0ABM8R7W1_9BURK|nr:TonB-dependent siderophore receptor [Paraburkholderia haematera]CAE6738115.1 Ferrichrome receptor FcuA [Paraburkholderia haematera]